MIKFWGFVVRNNFTIRPGIFLDEESHGKMPLAKLIFYENPARIFIIVSDLPISVNDILIFRKLIRVSRNADMLGPALYNRHNTINSSIPKLIKELEAKHNSRIVCKEEVLLDGTVHYFKHDMGKTFGEAEVVNGDILCFIIQKKNRKLLVKGSNVARKSDVHISRIISIIDDIAGQSSDSSSDYRLEIPSESEEVVEEGSIMPIGDLQRCGNLKSDILTENRRNPRTANSLLIGKVINMKSNKLTSIAQKNYSNEGKRKTSASTEASKPIYIKKLELETSNVKNTFRTYNEAMDDLYIPGIEVPESLEMLALYQSRKIKLHLGSSAGTSHTKFDVSDTHSHVFEHIPDDQFVVKPKPSFPSPIIDQTASAIGLQILTDDIIRAHVGFDIANWDKSIKITLAQCSTISDLKVCFN